jgi:hypothetical protein
MVESRIQATTPILMDGQGRYGREVILAYWMQCTGLRVVSIVLARLLPKNSAQVADVRVCAFVQDTCNCT